MECWEKMRSESEIVTLIHTHPFPSAIWWKNPNSDAEINKILKSFPVNSLNLIRIKLNPL